jgi:aspartate carbamoyltransferase catalytic subunit
VNQIFVAPPELQMGSDLLEYLKQASVPYSLTDSLDDVIPTADAFYMMRMQDEYSATSDKLREEYRRFHLSVENVARMKPEACIIHPLPRRDEVPLEIDSDPRAKYWEAVLRGKHVRMALLMHMFGCTESAHR